MANLVLPSSTAVVNEWLKAQAAVTDICDKRIAPKLVGVFPSIRLADVGPMQRGPEEELRRVQIECWATDYDTAEQLAHVVVSVVPEARGQWPSGYCAGGDVVSGPFANPDPDSERYRHQLDVGLWLYPTPPA